MSRDPTIGLIESPQKKQKKDRTDFGTPPPAPKKSLVKAGEEHEQGRPRSGQARVDGTNERGAKQAYEEKAFDYAVAAQTWKEAQARRDVRLDDLVKVHTHRPFDAASASRVSREAAAAVQGEKDTLTLKQEKKKALDEAWATYASFRDEEPIRPLIPDDTDE